jgi:hypothetical protein
VTSTPQAIDRIAVRTVTRPGSTPGAGAPGKNTPEAQPASARPTSTPATIAAPKSGTATRTSPSARATHGATDQHAAAIGRPIACDCTNAGPNAVEIPTATSIAAISVFSASVARTISAARRTVDVASGEAVGGASGGAFVGVSDGTVEVAFGAGIGVDIIASPRVSRPSRAARRSACVRARG